MKSNFENKKYVSVLINGELYILNYEIILDKYLSFLKISKSEIASNIFEFNNKIILKAEFNKLKLSNFTKIELVQVVGGG
jgi:thiamine biosynthesis protein ThiS